MATKANYFVIDGDGLTSFNAAKEAPESFRGYAQALRRAKELADSSPGVPVLICMGITAVCSPISAPVVTRIGK